MTSCDVLFTGLVRGVDADRRILYLTTPLRLDRDEVQAVNVLVLGNPDSLTDIFKVITFLYTYRPSNTLQYTGVSVHLGPMPNTSLICSLLKSKLLTLHNSSFDQ